MSRDQLAAASAPEGAPAEHPSYTPGQFVWVRVGKTDHHAHVVEVGTPKCKVKWCSTLDVEEVDVQSISPGLTPRKRSRRQTAAIGWDGEGDVHVEGTRTNQRGKKAKGGTHNNEDKKKGGRLSLGRNRKRLAKARREKQGQVDQSQAKDTSNGPEKESEAPVEQTTTNVTAANNAGGNKLSDPDADEGMAVDGKAHTTSDAKEAGDAARVVTPATRTSTAAESSHASPKYASLEAMNQHKNDQGDAGACQTPVVSAVNKRAAKRSAFSMAETDANNKCRAGTTIGRQKVLPSYHLNPASSAYVQHIAEICHAILNDMRWRVTVAGLQNEGGTAPDRMSSNTGRTRSILAWEHGDDLSAVSAFAGVWDGQIGGQSDLLCPGVSDEKGIDGNDGCEDSDEQIFLGLGRALLLYSRLFVRRGPWFTIDDLYFRYYRHYFSVPDVDETGTESPGDGTASAEDDKEDACPSDDNGDSQSNVRSIQLPTLSDHQAALVCFFKDIIQLHNMRLIRSFDSERECGIIAGNTSSDGSGVLLNASERSEVLNRLGGGKHLKRRSTGLSRGSSGGSSRGWGDDRGRDDRAGGRRSRFSGATDNLIWQQMITQRSVFSSGSSAILPVRRHVDETVSRKFGARILGSVDNASRSRSNIRQVTSIIDQAWDEAMKAFEMVADESSLDFIMMSSIRLRESPLLSLRRASRLYLCAVGGPGSMRGDSGTSGWASVSESTLKVSKQTEDSIPVEARRVLESGGSSWHRVSFPGLSSRLGLSSYSFAASYEPTLNSAQDASKENNLRHLVQVFPDQSGLSGFRRWEVCAELRSAIDTLMELNEMIQYLSRRKKKQEIDDEDVEDMKSVGSKSGTGSCRCDESIVNAVPVPDHFNLLTSDGRKDLVGKLSVGPAASAIYSQVESTLRSFEHSSDGRTGDIFTNDAERIIFVLSVIGLRVLQSHFSSMSSKDMCRLAQRPWLRHLVWESTLAYLLWDCVAVLEKKKCYDLAVSILETILTGSPVQGQSLRQSFDPFVRSLISRRVRGKAVERLIIDRGHLEKAAAKSQKKSENTSKGVACPPNGGKKIHCVETSEQHTATQRLCLEVVTKEGAKSSIPFSAVRSLARRLKVPLKDTLADVENAEMKALEIRCENDVKQNSTEAKSDAASAAKAKSRKRQSGYVEWTPTTDFSVANSIENEAKDGVGKRCAYVGWDDEDYSGGMARARSMNVEEHALAEYSAGRLPNLGEKIDTTSTNVIGGWVGWHDEGGHVRALFRILCANEILGTQCPSSVQCTERHTIYLSPYHGAPLDLHVATQGLVRGFYERRRSHIEKVLGDLERLSPQQICDLVHRSIAERMEEVRRSGSTGSRDALLCRDVGELRTLSFLAAALGGKALTAIFRCLCYDYRHYAGGLPDLTMARAVYEEGCGDDDNKESGTGTQQLVDLGSWIGEAFDVEEIEKGQVVELCRILADRDDEFLGCNKIGETGAGSSQQRFRQRRGKKQDETTKRGEEHLSSETVAVPPKLVLSHQGRTIRAECMFVEVKSANDRLDARQEDWLNVLDRVANARVCKFSAKKKAKKAKRGT